MTRLNDVFALNRKGFNAARALKLLWLLSVPWVVLVEMDDEKYLLSVIFAVLFVAFSDPGGTLAEQLRPMVGVAVGGALLTWLGYAIGDGGWGWIVLATFVVTVLCGLTMRFGIHTFIAAYLVNVWFLVALSLPRLQQRGRPISAPLDHRVGLGNPAAWHLFPQRSPGRFAGWGVGSPQRPTPSRFNVGRSQARNLIDASVKCRASIFRRRETIHEGPLRQACPVAVSQSSDLLRLVRACPNRGALARHTTRARGGCSCEATHFDWDLSSLLRRV